MRACSTLAMFLGCNCRFEMLRVCTWPIREASKLTSSGIASSAPRLADISRWRSVEHPLAPARRSLMDPESEFYMMLESIRESRLYIWWKDLKRSDIPSGPKLFPERSMLVSCNYGFFITASKTIVALLSPRLQLLAFILLREELLATKS